MHEHFIYWEKENICKLFGSPCFCKQEVNLDPQISYVFMQKIAYICEKSPLKRGLY